MIQIDDTLVSLDVIERYFLCDLSKCKGECCVEGDSETDYMWRGRIKSSTHKAVREKPWQCSVNASAGMQFNLSSVVGLYVEPGVSYYFDNGSSVSNIYKEKPLNFNLEFGLRFSLGL